MLHLTRDQVRTVDRLAVERYHIPSLLLMENAARGVTAVAKTMLRGKGRATVLILAGGGNNGGDGLAVARHLHNLGYHVLVGLCTDPAKYTGNALTNWQIVQAMNLPNMPATHSTITKSRAGLVIDAIFGTGLTQAPRPPFADIVLAVTATSAPVLAIDLPSGLDCDTGQPLGAVIRATRTVTFVAAKAGFAHRESKAYTGKVTVADIGCPRELTQQVQSA